jgi:CRP/FNR family transcriptional regulator, cyclic AMP receptor protein
MRRERQHNPLWHSDQPRMRSKAVARSWGLPDRILEEMMGGHATASYKKGSMIFVQGSPGDILFCVLSGLVKVCCPVKGRERITVDLAGPGELIGFAYVVDDVGRRTQAFEARAATACKLAVMTHERATKILETADRDALIRAIEHLNAAWSKALQTRVRFLGLDYRARLFEVLADLSARFGVKDARGTLLIPELSHTDFAQMVGCSRAAVSKLIENLISDGILARSGKRHIILRQDEPVRVSA